MVILVSARVIIWLLLVWAAVVRLFAFPIAPLIFAYIMLIFFEGFLPWFLVRHFLLTFLNVTFLFGFSFSGLFPLDVSWCGFFSIVFSFRFSVFLLVVPSLLSELLVIS